MRSSLVAMMGYARPRRSRRLLERLLLGVAGLVVPLLLALAAPQATFAHASFLGSTPAPGQRVERAPQRLVLTFTETLDPRLTRAKLIDAATGGRVAARATVAAGRRLLVTPRSLLSHSAYRVEWHSVSTDEGHALEGSFGFGVGRAAVDGASSIEQGPLAGGGWLRVPARVLFYLALMLFAGAVLLRTLVPRGGGRSWLVPAAVLPAVERAASDAVAVRERNVLSDAGLAATALAAVVALLDAAWAADGLSPHALASYLVSNPAGRARVGVVLLLGVASLLARRRRWVAALATLAALLLVALSGHASSVAPRAVAVGADWLHLAAAAIWLGGVGLIVAAWGPVLRRASPAARSAVVRHVLPRFGAVALPAFGVVVAAGTLNAALELGDLAALWSSGYGRILAAKVALVGLIAAASYAHALRLRPRLLAANPHPDRRLERRHWRLLSAEPLLALGVTVAVGFLVAFPLAPRQQDAAAAARLARVLPACNPCPLPMPRASELSVAGHAGSDIVAAWIRRDGRRLTGQVRALDIQGKPARDAVAVAGAAPAGCGPGCRRFTLTAQATLRVRVRQGAHVYTAELPTGWRPRASARAAGLLGRAQAAMRRLRTLRESELITSGPGSFALTRYRLQAPNRFSYVTGQAAQSITIGKMQWTRVGRGRWQRGEFGGGLAFRTRSWFSWTPYAQAVRLLDLATVSGRHVADIQLIDPGTPAWWRLRIELASMRVLATRLIAPGHFMTQRFFAFNRPLRIKPPPREP